MDVELWEGACASRSANFRDRNYWVAGEPELRRVQRIVDVRQDLRVGRRAESAIVLRHNLVSRDALHFTRERGGWSVRYGNRNGVEHRRWGQPFQPDVPFQSVEFLEAGEHAFLIRAGEHSVRTYCTVVRIHAEDSGPDLGFHHGETPGGAGVTPMVQHTEPRTLERQMRTFAEVYREFLVWPPRRRPAVVSDRVISRELHLDPASAVAKVIGYAVSIGYLVGDLATKRSDDLPFFLARSGVLDFEGFVRRRPADGG